MKVWYCKANKMKIEAWKTASCITKGELCKDLVSIEESEIPNAPWGG